MIKETFYFSATFWDGATRNGMRMRLTGLSRRDAQRLYRLTGKMQLLAWSDGGDNVGRTPYQWSWGVVTDEMAAAHPEPLIPRLIPRHGRVRSNDT